MDKIKLTAGVFVILAIIGTTWYVAVEDQANLYQCEDIAGLCFKLSKVNDAGIQTRCYHLPEEPTRYKNCKEGWVKVEFTEITGTETILPDREIYKIQTEWTNRQDAESYITQLKTEISYTHHITTIEQVPFSDSITVSFLGYINKGEDRLARIGGILSFKETVTKQEIEAKVENEAQRMFNEWRPSLIIDRKDKII